ncbi:hypothetical protein BDR26DRAFT_328501 [Obelidium mucronatum]|nr:hypothetical protein BDR26DRAFT_328501 [Obelidium mucronatum]
MFCNTETGQPLCFSLAKSPYYDTVKTAIEKHGGKIVAPHEPNIDMKLASADMARVGGVCYSTFVFDAIREQRLPDKEKYLLTEGSRHVETTSSSSEVASKQQVAKKSGRTPFSKEDDDVLIDILVRNTTNTSGNALYKDLEQQNPRHTFHSWRDRAVKVLLPKLKQNGELERRRALLATSSSSKESNVDTTKPVITTATTGSSQCLTSSGTSGLHCAVVAQHVSGRGDKDGKRDQNGPPPESQDENHLGWW